MSTTYHVLDAYLNGKKMADFTATKTKPNLNLPPHMMSLPVFHI